jgi:hypothetical protein
MMLFVLFLGFSMHTSIDLEDDVLAVAREMARMQNVMIGVGISRLMHDEVYGYLTLPKSSQVKSS